MIDPKEVGHRLKSLRKARGMTQEQLSDILHVSPNHVYKMESGGRMPSMEICVNISKFFGVSIDYILIGKEHENESPKELLHQAMHCLSRLDKLY